MSLGDSAAEADIAYVRGRIEDGHDASVTREALLNYHQNLPEPGELCVNIKWCAPLLNQTVQHTVLMLAGSEAAFAAIASAKSALGAARLAIAGQRAAAAQRKLARLREIADATIPANWSRSAWGALVWGRGGTGNTAAANARGLIGRSAADLSQIPGLTLRSATAWRDVYRQAVKVGRGVRNPADSTNRARMELMNDIIKTLRRS